MAVIQSYMDSLLVPIVLVSNDYEVARVWTVSDTSTQFRHSDPLVSMKKKKLASIPPQFREVSPFSGVPFDFQEIKTVTFA